MTLTFFHCVFLSGSRAELRVCTVNARPVGIRSFPSEQRPLSICFSALPEGRNMNVIAVGCCGGIIEILSSWTLALIRRLDLRAFGVPEAFAVHSVRFSSTAHRLFVAFGPFVCCLDSEERRPQAGPSRKQVVPVIFTRLA